MVCLIPQKKKKKSCLQKKWYVLGLQLLKREWKRLRQKAQIATISGPFINLLISEKSPNRELEG